MTYSEEVAASFHTGIQESHIIVSGKRISKRSKRTESTEALLLPGFWNLGALNRNDRSSPMHDEFMFSFSFRSILRPFLSSYDPCRLSQTKPQKSKSQSALLALHLKIKPLSQRGHRSHPDPQLVSFPM
jgi:hypothetical protein